MTTSDETKRWEFKAAQAKRVQLTLARVNLSLSDPKPRTRKPFENDLGPGPDSEWQ